MLWQQNKSSEKNNLRLGQNLSTIYVDLETEKAKIF